MEEIRGNKMKFEKNKLVLTAGATAANEIIISCLADPGEAFLVPTPYYPGYLNSIIFLCLSFLSFLSLGL